MPEIALIHPTHVLYLDSPRAEPYWLVYKGRKEQIWQASVLTSSDIRLGFRGPSLDSFDSLFFSCTHSMRILLSSLGQSRVRGGVQSRVDISVPKGIRPKNDYFQQSKSTRNFTIERGFTFYLFLEVIPNLHIFLGTF